MYERVAPHWAARRPAIKLRRSVRANGDSRFQGCLCSPARGKPAHHKTVLAVDEVQQRQCVP
jgi:hypothetical protein